MTQDPKKPSAPEPDEFDVALQQSGGGWSKADDDDFDAAVKASGPKHVSPYAARRAAQGKSVTPDVKKSFMENLEAFGDTGAIHVLNAAQGLPGMKAFQAGAGALGSQFTDNPMSYRESYKVLDEEAEEKIPAALRIIEQMVGGTVLMPSAAAMKAAGGAQAWLVQNISKLKAAQKIAKAPKLARAAAAGATAGAVDPLLQGDPDKGVADRLKEAGVGAVIGGAAAPALHGVMNAAKTVKDVTKAAAPRFLGGAKSVGTQMQDMARERRAVGPLYEKALANAGEATPEIKKFMADPDIAARVEQLQSLDAFKGMSPVHPRMIDEVIKTMSDKIKILDRGLSGIDPKDANIMRSKIADLKTKRAKLVELLGEEGEKPPIMFDVPAERHVVEPDITPGRETLQGPMRGGQRGQVLPGRDETIAGPIPEGSAGRVRGDQAQVSVGPEGNATVVSPRDVQGPAGPGFMLRARPDEVVSEAIPAKPAFTMKGTPDVVKPGIDVETPAMRVQTAPAEKVPAMMKDYGPAYRAAADRAGERAAFSKGLAAMRTAAKGGALTEKEFRETSIEAMREFAKKATPEERKKALAAILGTALPRVSSQLKSNSAIGMILGGGALGGPGGMATAAALKTLPGAARAHQLRNLLDPMSETAFMKALVALNAGVKPD